jgi:DNA polymerase-1
VSAIEHTGVPLDTNRLGLLRDNWDHIKDRLIEEVDADYHVFDGRTFKRDRFRAYLIRKGIPWQCHESGSLDLSDDTFSSMANIYPILQPLYGLRSALSKLRLSKLAVGCDGRNRATLFPFTACTGRNAPSNSEFIFGPHVWLRGLIKPEPGCGLAYIDWSQQEVGIAAALSKDPAMLEAYLSGDVYLAFAKLSGALPPDAVRYQDERTESVRELFKQCILGVQYGMGPQGLSGRIKQPGAVGTHHATARALLRAHHEVFGQFWRWSEAAVDCAMQYQSLSTVFDWHILVDDDSNPRSLQNFPMQANAADMLRLACCLATERCVEVCAPVHDAMLIHAPLDRLEDDIRTTQTAMAEASRVVLKGFELRSDHKKIVRYPGHYMDEERGRVMWDKVWSLVNRQSSASQRDAA